MKERLPDQKDQELLHYLLQGELPIPCEKNKQWHEKMKSNRRLAIGLEDKKVMEDWREEDEKTRRKINRQLWNPIGSKNWEVWVVSAVIYIAIGMVLTLIPTLIYTVFIR